MDCLGSAKYYALLNLSRRYWQYCVVEECMAKNTFHTKYSLYEWMVLPMGLMNTPAMFMQVMNNLFTDLLDHGIIVFRDDVLVYNHTRDEHFQLLCMVFDKLCEHCFYCKLKKCSSFHTTTAFLVFNITLDGFKICNAKVKSFCNWPQPMNVK